MQRKPIEERLGEPLRDYWLERVAQHTHDTYAGILISKFPEDLRTYEHLLWDSRANVVIEIGTHWGGSALWFRDRLTSFARYRPPATVPVVVSVDIETNIAHRALAQVDPNYASAIRLVDGDVRDPTTATRVRNELAPGSRCLVVEDSAHTYETTYAALQGFSDFVASGGYLVVEDGCVDIDSMRLDDAWPRGVIPAMEDWLRSSAGGGFRRRRDLERYGITCHPLGYLQRRG